MQQIIKEAITNTLAYFDIFDFPLKKEEIWDWLFCEQLVINNQQQIIFNKEDFFNDLRSLAMEGIVAEKEGYYFFSGRENILELRKQRQEISLRKIEKANKLVKWWLRFVPWVEAVFLANNLGYLNAQEDSDIDLLIITKKKRLWLARLWSVLPLKIFNLRPTKKIKKDKFCLSYFLSTDNLNLFKYELAAEMPILVYWFVLNRVLYQKGDYQKDFRQANKWVLNFLPNIWVNKLEVDNNGASNGWRVGDWLEMMARKIQIWYLPKVFKQAKELGEKVYFDEKIIKLHLGSRGKGQGVKEKWQMIRDLRIKN